MILKYESPWPGDHSSCVSSSVSFILRTFRITALKQGDNAGRQYDADDRIITLKTAIFQAFPGRQAVYQTPVFVPPHCCITLKSYILFLQKDLI